MNVHDQLSQLAATVRGAKTMPMSGSCLVNRAEMLEVLERLCDELPRSLAHADALLSGRDAVLAAGREQAESLLEGARAEREQLIEHSEVLVAARARAATVTAAAQAESTRLHADRRPSRPGCMLTLTTTSRASLPSRPGCWPTPTTTSIASLPSSRCFSVSSDRR